MIGLTHCRIWSGVGIILIGAGLASPSLTYAGQWPKGIGLPLFVFGSNLMGSLGDSGYVEMEGLVPDADAEVPDEYDEFRFLLPEPPLGEGKAKEVKAFIETEKVELRDATQVAVAFPLRLSIEAKVSGEEKTELLESKILSVSILKTSDKDYTLKQLGAKHVFRIGDIAKHSHAKISDEKGLFRLKFDHILVSDSIEVPSRTEFRVRIEWHRGSFKEEGSEFAIGDQIRVTRAKSR